MDNLSSTFSVADSEKHLRQLQEKAFGKVRIPLHNDQLSSMAAECPLLETIWKNASTEERERYLRDFLLLYPNHLDKHLLALKQNILDLCPGEFKIKISGLTVGTLHYFQINAHRLPPPYENIVIVDHGLFGFFQDIANIVVADLLALVGDPLRFLEGDLDDEITKKAIMSCLCFLSGRPVAARNRLITFPAHAEFILKLTSSLRDEMELFILAHEFGHSVITSEQQQQSELLADEWAMSILKNISSSHLELGLWKSKPDKYAPAAGLVVLYAHQLLNYVAKDFDKIVEAFELGPLQQEFTPDEKEIPSHPPTEERIQNLLRLIHPTWQDPDLASFINNLPDLFGRLHYRLKVWLER